MVEAGSILPPPLLLTQQQGVTTGAPSRSGVGRFRHGVGRTRHRVGPPYRRVLGEFMSHNANSDAFRPGIPI